MAMQTNEDHAARTPLSRERVLRAAVALADEHGIESVSMRKLGQELGVDPMSLYNHVANKEDLLDGMAEAVIGEIDLTPGDGEWKTLLRARVMTARETMMRHPWASRVIETRSETSPTIMRYFDAVVGIFRSGGFSIDLTHHALHTLGSRLLGFTQEFFADSDSFEGGPEALAVMAHQMAGEFPNLSEMMLEISHDEATIVGSGCDDQFEFTFALDLLLGGLERLRDAEAP